MNILIAEDEPGTRMSVAVAVERLGHRAMQASDGAEAWRRFAADRPEVVITDWAMPNLDGTQLTARVRAASDAGYTYIMVLTGRADDSASREAVRAGADDVLTKPLDFAELERGLIAAERLTSLHRRMRADAALDPVTGTGTRRRLDQDLLAVCARVARYGHTYCIAALGVEPAEDHLIAAAGRALAEAVRSGDMVYRSGPARFVVTLPEQAPATANLAAERLRRATELALGAEAGGHSYTVGVGIAFTTAESTPLELLAEADAALAHALAAPGGQVVGDAAGAGTLRLLVADDDPVSRLMLGAIVKRERGFELVGEATDANQAIELALRRRPDVVLLDVDMPGGGGARAAIEIREALPGVRIIAISADDSQGSQYDMMRAGAVGFMIKGAADEEILRVIRSSMRW